MIAKRRTRGCGTGTQTKAEPHSLSWGVRAELQASPEARTAPGDEPRAPTAMAARSISAIPWW
jgi:hypothetical protein